MTGFSRSSQPASYCSVLLLVTSTSTSTSTSTRGFSEIFLPNFQNFTPHRQKANFHQSLVQGKLIRIWWIGFHPLCGVRRSPDWLISRPLRWLSCRHYSHSLLSTIRFAGSLNVPESRQIKAFYHRFVTENLGISYPLDRLPGGN